MDFCRKCGEYLRWEPTGQTPTIDPPAPAAPARGTGTPLMSPAQPSSVQVTLHSPTGEWIAVPEFSVAPAGEVQFRVRVRNNSEIVDHFEVSLDGLPEDWWTATPSTVFLMPYSSGGDCEQDVIVTISPPRSSEVAAGRLAIRVVVTSRQRRAAPARVAATLQLEPFIALDMEVLPSRRDARWRGRFDVRLRNDGNSPATAAVTARDESDGARLKHSACNVTVAPGAEVGCKLRVRPKRPILFGRAVEHPLDVAATWPGEPPVVRRAALRQVPWFPRWTPALLVAAAVVIGAFLLLREPVPDVRGMSIDAARRELDEHHLDWRPPVLRRSAARVGTVIETIPAAGAERWRGSAVTLIAATNHARATVPDVRGATYADATLKLLKAGFRTTGKPPGDDANAKVTEQLPAAGARVSRKRPVALTFVPPHGDDEKAAKDGAGKPAGPVAVPAVAGASLSEALDSLRAAGLKPTTRRVISEEPAGSVLGTHPDGGKLAPGTPIEVRVSAGFPKIAFDDGKAVYLARGRDGRQRHRLELAGDGFRTQPSWTPDGQRLVYRAGTADQGRIYMTDGTDGEPSGGRPLTESGYDDRRPAVSPAGKLVAFVRGTDAAAAHRLCFVEIAGGDVQCLPEVAGGLTRPTWSPDGKSILALTGAGALMHFAARRDSSRWRNMGTLPLDQLGAIQFAAWSPQGTLAVALVASPGQPALYRSEGLDIATLEPIPFAGAACEIAWRADGEELIVAARLDDKGARCPNALASDPGAATRLAPDGTAAVGLGARMVNPNYRPISG